MSNQPAAIGKVLSANDLGLTGSHQGGIVVPKTGGLVDFFPSLNHGDVNPERFLNVKVPQLDSEFRFRFVYYNSRPRGEGTRNEFRLTGLAAVLRNLNAQVGDELIFRRNPEGAFTMLLKRQVPSDGNADQRGGWRLVRDEEVQ